MDRMRGAVLAYVALVGASRGLTLPPTLEAQPGEAAAVVERQVQAFNRHDLDAFLATYGDDIVMRTFGDTLMAKGLAPMRARYAGLFAQNPNVHVQIVGRVAVGRFVADHERASGTADGKSAEWLVVYEVRDGRIVRSLGTPVATAPPGMGVAADAPDAVTKRVGAAFNARDMTAAAALFADPVPYHPLGQDTVQRMTRSDMRAGYEAMVTQHPHVRHAVVQRMVAGPFVVEHERLTGMADGRVRNGLDILAVENGRVTGEWENQDQ